MLGRSSIPELHTQCNFVLLLLFFLSFSINLLNFFSLKIHFGLLLLLFLFLQGDVLKLRILTHFHPSKQYFPEDRKESTRQ